MKEKRRWTDDGDESRGGMKERGVGQGHKGMMHRVVRWPSGPGWAS